jgi:hypothetical protein
MQVSWMRLTNDEVTASAIGDLLLAVIVPSHTNVLAGDIEIDQKAQPILTREDLNMSGCEYFPRAACIGTLEAQVAFMCEHVSATARLLSTEICAEQNRWYTNVQERV